MFNYQNKDPVAVLDPEVRDTTEVLKKLEEINPAVLKEILIERVRGGITRRQYDLLMSMFDPFFKN